MLVIDRIQNNTALCEEMDSGAKRELALAFLPVGVKEGDILKEEKGHWVIDEKRTAQRKEDLSDRLMKLFKRK